MSVLWTVWGGLSLLMACGGLVLVAWSLAHRRLDLAAVNAVCAIMCAACAGLAWVMR